MKKTALFIAAFGVLALVGAGCTGGEENTDQNGGQNTETTTNNNNNGNGSGSGDNQNTTTPPTTTEGPVTTEDIQLTVEPTGNGNVRVSWTNSNPNRNLSYRVLHASRPDSTRPFYFQYMNSVSSTNLTGVPTGKRYFKVCEYNAQTQEFVRCSEQQEIEVR